MLSSLWNWIWEGSEQHAPIPEVVQLEPLDVETAMPGDRVRCVYDGAEGTLCRWRRVGGHLMARVVVCGHTRSYVEWVASEHLEWA